MKRVDPTAVVTELPSVMVTAGTWSKKLPQLVERLTCIAYEDGGRRAVSRLTLEWRDGSWRACLTEPDAALMIQCEAATPDEVLPALEGLLNAQTPPWQHCPWLKLPTGRKGRK